MRYLNLNQYKPLKVRSSTPKINLINSTTTPPTSNPNIQHSNDENPSSVKSCHHNPSSTSYVTSSLGPPAGGGGTNQNSNPRYNKEKTRDNACNINNNHRSKLKNYNTNNSEHYNHSFDMEEPTTVDIGETK
jgi:hypothetical protein